MLARSLLSFSLLALSSCSLFFSVSSQDECTPQSHPASCEGAILETCIRGDLFRIECESAELCDAQNNTCALCGDTFIQSANNEACDDGNTLNGDGCDAECKIESCGDGITNDVNEQCDDGDLTNEDSCTNLCQNARCGDGFRRQDLIAGEVGVEECDDNDNNAGDGCDANCVVEFCGDGIANNGDSFGNNQEGCDDANNDDTDACTNLCEAARCGDNILRTDLSSGELGFEGCDDGNNINGDGCRADCADVERCGNNLPDLGEVCDDGNNASTDGCRADCLGLEVCGDSLLDFGESCDDSNNIDDDGCDADCSFPEVVSVALGGIHTCALLDDGNVRCWGNGEFGHLGTGLPSDFGDDELPSIAPNVALGGRAIQIDAGDSHTCALLTTGNVRCWGEDFAGELGYGNTFQLTTPQTPAAAGDVNVGGRVLQISAGGAHTCALLEGGRVRCWGLNSRGQLGYGHTEDIGDDEVPAVAGDVNVGGVVIAVDAGVQHTCALLESGSVRCWGFGLDGRLGYGNTNNIGDNETPASAGNVAVGGSVVQISLGNDHSCAVLADNVRCWGRGSNGQLGYGNTNSIGDNESPASAGNVNVGGSVSSISSGTFYTCARLTNGAARCWGSDPSLGRLGYPGLNGASIGDNEAPATAGDINVGGFVTSITAKGHTCVVLITGRVRCWGGSEFGQLGYGNTESIGDDEVPASAGDVPLFPAVCGDGLVDAPESCEDLNSNIGDGCSPSCQTEAGFACVGEPSVCHPIVCGDGFVDGSEQCDDGNLIDDDGCSLLCQFESFGLDCPANQTLIQLASTDVPKVIPDNNPVGVLSLVNVADNRSVRRVIVQIGNLTHAFGSDLEISLLSPNNTSVLLSDNHGSSNNLVNTLFDDSCIALNGPIANGVAPFTGCFAPDNALSVFNNQSANGQWRLKIVDTAAQDIGTLNAWTLGLCVQ